MSKHSRWYIVLAAVLVLVVRTDRLRPEGCGAGAGSRTDPGSGRRTHRSPGCGTHRRRLWNPLRRRPPKNPSRLP